MRFHAYAVLIQDIKSYWNMEMLWLITPLGKKINVNFFLPSLVPLLMRLEFSFRESSSLSVLFLVFVLALCNKKKFNGSFTIL